MTRSPIITALISELYRQMHPKNLRLYVNESVGADNDEMAFLAKNTDGIMLMNYDLHEVTSGPGPIAPEDWFVGNLKRVLAVVPKEKLICAIGNYGYDWTMSLASKGHPAEGARCGQHLGAGRMAGGLGFRCRCASGRR